MIKAKEYIIKMNDAKVLVNSFVEALGVVFILTDFKLNQPRKNEQYIKEVKQYFSKYNDCETIKDFKRLLAKNSFRYDAPVELILRYANDVLPTDELMKRGDFTLEEFERLKRNFLYFYEESKFEDFFKSKEQYYKKNIRNFIDAIGKYNPQQYLFNFIGMSSSNLNICLMHGVTTSNYGLNINNKLYCCVRPYRLSRFNDIDFAYDLPYVTSLVLHEFAHSFINPLTDKYVNEKLINKNKLEKIMNEHAYGEHYITAVNETIIRAIECIYIKEFFNDVYIQFKNDYLSDGFTLIDDVVEAFDNYVSKRDKIVSIEKIYSELMKLFYL